MLTKVYIYIFQLIDFIIERIKKYIHIYIYNLYMKFPKTVKLQHVFFKKFVQNVEVKNK